MNNLQKFFTILIVSVVFLSGLAAQKITQKGIVYFHEDQWYSFEELGPLLKDQSEAYYYYHKSLKQRRKAKINGLIASGAIVTGVVAIAIDPDVETTNCFLCLSTGQSIALIGWLGVTPIFGTIGIIKKIREVNSRKKAINSYNEGLNHGYKDKASEMELHIGQTQNGLGVILNF